MLRRVCSLSRANLQRRVTIPKQSVICTKRFVLESRIDSRVEGLEPIFESWQQDPESHEDVLERQKAAELFSQAKVKEAAAVLDQLLAKDTTSINTLKLQSATVCVIPGRYDEAVKNISKAIAFCPKMKGAELWATKAFILTVGKQYDQAVVCAKHALQRKPISPQANYAMALAQSGLKQYYPSLLHFDTALEGSPKEVEVMYWRGQAYFYIDKVQEAFEWLKADMGQNPLRGNFYKGLKAFHEGNFTEALSHFSVAKTGRSWNPVDDTDVHSWKGECYLRLSEFNKALESFEAALQKNPKDALSLHGKGEALVSLNKREEARDFFKSAYSNDPTYYKSDYFRIKQLPKL